jgi:uncharacterized membrane protein
MSFLNHLRIRPRLVVTLGLGLASAVFWPGPMGLVTRALLGWDVAVWSYLTLVIAMMLRADHGYLRRTAAEQAESATTVMVIVAVASIVSLVGVVFQLAAAKAGGGPAAWPHLLLALMTVVGSWILLPTVFALTYASVFFRDPKGQGLRVPGEDEEELRSYHDFLYFSFTIAVACQTSDIEVTTRKMRSYVLAQSLLSFLFNTAILAFSINIAASMFG